MKVMDRNSKYAMLQELGVDAVPVKNSRQWITRDGDSSERSVSQIVDRLYARMISRGAPLAIEDFEAF